MRKTATFKTTDRQDTVNIMQYNIYDVYNRRKILNIQDQFLTHYQIRWHLVALVLME